MTICSKKYYPRIRSYIRREGRATAGQKNAIDKVWNNYCLDPDITYDFSKVFGRNAPLIVEIGFGNGKSLAEMAGANPNMNYLGIEVHKPGVGSLLMQLEKKGLKNVRVYYHDAIEILEQKIPDHTVAGLHLFFPDPWHKRRHHKRRIVRPSFIELLNKKLVSNGYFHAATDWGPYAEEMLKILTSTNLLINASKSDGFCERPNYRPMTKFESRGIGLGHGVWDLIFKKN